VRNWRAWIFSFGFLLLIFWVIGGSQMFQACVQEKQNATSNDQFQNSISNFIIMRGPYRDCIGSFIHENAEATIAAFTIVLAFSTIFLWGATRDLVDGAEKAERRQLRAYVGVEKLEFECPDLNGKCSEVEPADLTIPGLIHKNFLVVKVRNFGQTPARDVTVYAYSVFADFPARLPDDYFLKNDTDQISMAEVRPTLARFLLHKDQSEISKHILQDLSLLKQALQKPPKKQTYVFGRIYYRDIYDRSWRTKFCYSWEPWHPLGARFVAYEEYNGEDQKELDEWPRRV
jgi:hypothetical protein